MGQGREQVPAGAVWGSQPVPDGLTAADGLRCYGGDGQAAAVPPSLTVVPDQRDPAPGDLQAVVGQRGDLIGAAARVAQQACAPRMWWKRSGLPGELRLA
jgi:hypothetical protein